ncbi:MAG TPA: peptidylprolyl isomerase [Planctomycetota bacterium]
MVARLLALAGLLAALMPALSAAPVQDPPFPEGIVATWNGGEVGMEEFERFLGATFRGQQLGREALIHLLQLTLVEREAETRGLRVDPAALRERVAFARSEAERSQIDLDALLVERGIKTEEFVKMLGDSLLHEALVRQDLGRGAEEPVSSDELHAWSQERLAKLLDATTAAPVGYALHSPPFVVTERELGHAIRTALGALRARGYLRDLVLNKEMARWAQANGVALTDALMQEEIDFQRARAEEGGVSLEALLEAMGSSLEKVKANVQLRTTSWLREYSRRRWDEAWFDTLTSEERHELERAHGERRQVAWILLRAVEAGAKQSPLDLSFEEAGSELERILTKVKTEADFLAAAEQYSEDEASRVRKGFLGFLSRSEPPAKADPALCAAAFAAEPGLIAGPFRVRTGIAACMVTEILPMPDEAEFRARVRRARHAELREEILDGIGLRTAFDPE